VFESATDLLDDLRWHWGDAYLIYQAGFDDWVAKRRDDGAQLRAKSSAGLHAAIIADYTAHPVSR
jgi:hypothetical protein